MFFSSYDNASIESGTNGVFENSRIASCITSSNANSIGSKFQADDSILDDNCSDSIYSFNHSLGHITEADGDLTLFENDLAGTRPSNLSNYGLPDVGNFEDVERMFASLDSAFELGVLDDKNGLEWNSPTGAIERYDNGLETGSNFTELNGFTYISENAEASEQNNVGCIHDTSMENGCLSHKSEATERKDQSILYWQLNVHDKQPKVQNHSEENEKIMYSENGNSSECISYLCDDGSKFPSVYTTSEFTSPVSIKKQKQNPVHDSSWYSPHDTTDKYSENSSSPSIQSIEQTIMSSSASENKCFSSIPPWESFSISNQVQLLNSSQNPSGYSSAFTFHEKGQMPHSQTVCMPEFIGNARLDMMVQDSSRVPVSIQKHVHHYQNKAEICSVTEGISPDVPEELGSSVVQEGSSLNSGFGEVSLEATSFQQLQFAMEKLDIRMKLCFRDSLYRLARNAEKRNKVVNLSGRSAEDRGINGAPIVGGNDDCSGLITVEADTNPIDRSIAHLLFHRRSDASVLSTHDAASGESNIKVI